ncbi:MAG: caspase family protein [Pseudorhodoplanes sp.]
MLRLFAAFALIFAALSPAAAQEKRIALIIGNSAYKNTASLATPVNDAIDLAAALNKFGFAVTRVTNANGNEMRRAIDDFSVAAKRADIALFFYAGHGIADGPNYWLIPTDGKLTSLEDVMAEKLDLQRIWEKMGTIKGASLMLLDAGRTNPFRVSQSSGRVDAPLNGLIAFSTAPGTEPFDGKGRNSPYATALLKHMSTKGLALEQVFKRVRVNVIQVTEAKQTPWESSSLSKDIVFVR